MNIVFTNFCNRRCSYCFAASKLYSTRARGGAYINFKNLEIIINFLKKSKKREVGIIGGEPTLHPKFREAAAMILGAGLNITIFTNGIIREENILFLKTISHNRCMILVNINTPKSYTISERSTINNVLRNLNEKITLGFNIYKNKFNMDFILKLIKKYGLKKCIRVGQAVPIVNYDNQYVQRKEYRKVAKKLVEFARKCDNLDISLDFDCGFTLCSFTKEECGELFYNNSVLRTCCTFPIDVAPDLTIWSCFANSTIWNRKLTDFRDLDEIHEFYSGKFRKISRMGTTSRCLSCKYLKRGQCNGGCLAYTLNAFSIQDRKRLISSD